MQKLIETYVFTKHCPIKYLLGNNILLSRAPKTLMKISFTFDIIFDLFFARRLPVFYRLQN